MSLMLLQPVRYMAQALVEESTPRQMAVGFALGMVVGLVPKGNLTAVVLMTLMCMLRINLAVGLVSAFVFSWIGMLTDPLTHTMGLWLLSHDTLVPLWTTLYDTTVMPWTAFNNTVVLGSLVLGLLLCGPAYWASKPPLTRYAPPLAAWMRKFRIVQLLWGAEWAGRMKGV